MNEKEKGKVMEQNRRETRVTRAIKLWTGATFAAFLAAGASFAVLLWVEKNQLSDYEKTTVYAATGEIPAGQLITKENLEEYFQKKEIDASMVPACAITEADAVKDGVAKIQIGQGVFLTEGMFQPVERIAAGMKEPVVAGFRAEDLCQVVGGVLRSGDRIHVYASEEGMGTFLIWENVFVQQVFDAGGKVIESGDVDTAAQRINVFLDKEDVEAFYTRLDQASLRVVKIWKRGEEEW
jgi:hypothetical protein